MLVVLVVLAVAAAAAAGVPAPELVVWEVSGSGPACA